MDKGQASLLFLPVVIACAIRYGFGPAICGAILSFLSWDFFFLPPFYTFVVRNREDWLSLIVFLVAAVSTAHLASEVRAKARLSQEREEEITTLFEASEVISAEVDADQLLPTLALQLETLCGASRSLTFQRSPSGLVLSAEKIRDAAGALATDERAVIAKLAQFSFDHALVIGFGPSQELWKKAAREIDLRADAVTLPKALLGSPGVYIPLRAGAQVVGVLHVGPRRDLEPYSPLEERLILTLANHAAVVIARRELAAEAAEAAALREADVLKDSLLSLVSHELRTPLSAIKACASGLLQPHALWEESSRMEALRTIDAESDRLSQLVSNLLDLSRLTAGSWRPVKDWCDLLEVAGTALDRIAPTAAARVEILELPNLPLIRADYTQLALVMSNLLENAAKYAPGESPIQLRLAPAPPASVVIVVRDFGLGIGAGESERLFDRFYRGERHRNSSIHGTGLGLALCSAIVRAHEGRIWAGNAPPDEPPGAVFQVVLPVGDSTEG